MALFEGDDEIGKRAEDLFRLGLRILPKPAKHLVACALGLRLHLDALRDLQSRAIKVNHVQSRALKDNQGQSVFTSTHFSKTVIKGNQGQSRAVKGNQGQSREIKGDRKGYLLLRRAVERAQARHREQSRVIKGHQGLPATAPRCGMRPSSP